MIPKIIHHTSGTNSWEERRVIGQAKKIMPDFEFKFWSDQANADLIDHFFPQYVDAYHALPSGIVRTDVARCVYMYAYGGIYADTDYRFIRPLNSAFLSNRCVLGIEERHNKTIGGGDKIGNAFLASEAGFNLWPEFIESIFYRAKQGEERIVFIGGPHALSLFLKERNDLRAQITLMPPEAIYPSFRMAKLKTYRDETTIGAHLCWGSWRDKGTLQGIKSRARRLISAVI